MNKLLFICLVISTGMLKAQNTSAALSSTLHSVHYFPLECCNTSNASALGQLLEMHYHCPFRLVHTATTGHSVTYQFIQTASGLDVFGSYAIVTLLNNTRSFSVTASLFPDLPSLQPVEKDFLWLFSNNTWTQVKQNTLFEREGLHQWEIFSDKAGNELYRYDAAQHAKNADSTVRVRVFNTDPITTAHKTYTVPYLDYNDSDVAVLNAERQWKNVKCRYSNDTFTIGNKYLVSGKWNNFTSYDPVYKVHDTVFDYTRHQHEFEDVMVLYHVTSFREYLSGLGMPNLGFMSMVFDAHGTKEEQSSYVPGWGLVFGTGGIDDAEDAEVIIHEYTHSIREFLAPASNIGQERAAIEEGTCDYMATSYKMSIDSFGWRKFAYWDGNNPALLWTGRDVASKKIYPQALTADFYQNAEIWSSALMRIYFKLGKNTTDRLILEFISYLSPNLSMPDAARLVMKADTALFGGINAGVILKTFQETHILPWASGLVAGKEASHIILSHTADFMNRLSPLYISIPSGSEATCTITNSNGQVLLKMKIEDESTAIRPDEFAPGMYFLTVKTAEEQLIQKLILF